jgi:serine/threonine protein phosphatase PrpC
MRIISAGRTDIGLKRKNNEDAYLERLDLGVFAVADGIGGSAAGEIASGIFVETAREVFERGGYSDTETSTRVQEVFRLANERILLNTEEYPDHRGMGCTAELIAFRGGRFFVGHIGDSRTYLFRGGELRRITRDHSLVQDQLEQGLITREDAKRHRLRNVVLRAVGIDAAVALDMINGRIAPGDIALLCSDGLTDMVDEDLIEEILGSALGLTDKVEQLVESAKTAGGNDNITVVLCEVSNS